MRLSAIVFACLLGLQGCEQGIVAPPTVPGSGQLVPGTWYMHRADEKNLPADISTRFVGVAQEVTYVDSAVLTIRADLTYEQRYWTRVTVTGILDRRDVIIDAGTFNSTAGGFALRSSIRERTFTMTVPSTGNLVTNEQMVFFLSNPPVTVGSYRLTRP